MTIKEYDVVRLRRPMPENGLAVGARGTLVLIHDDGKAYEVEFCDGEGRTLALLTLDASDVERVASGSRGVPIA